MLRWWDDGAPAAGLFAGSIAWLISTQLNYALVGWACSAGAGWVTSAAAAALMVVSLGGGLLSWRAWANAGPVPEPDSSIAAPRRLLAGIGVLSAALFALVIGLQGTAGLLLQGCER
jgi:hypothetical protein